MFSRSTAVTTRSSTQSRASSSQNVSDIETRLGKPPLLEGEDSAQYEALAQQIQDAVHPRDGIEKIGARDLTDLT